MRNGFLLYSCFHWFSISLLTAFDAKMCLSLAFSREFAPASGFLVLILSCLTLNSVLRIVYPLLSKRPTSCVQCSYFDTKLIYSSVQYRLVRFSLVMHH